MQRACALLVFVMWSAGCGHPVMQADVPALLTNPGPQTLQEIEQTISTALNGIKTTLAEDALTKTSVLVIERGMQGGIDRLPEPGRDTGRPYRFQLVIRGSQCLLVDQQSGIHWPLTEVECVRE